MPAVRLSGSVCRRCVGTYVNYLPTTASNRALQQPLQQVQARRRTDLDALKVTFDLGRHYLLLRFFDH